MATAPEIDSVREQIEQLVRAGDTSRLREIRDQLKSAVDRRNLTDRAARYADDPVRWVRERLGQTVWSKQGEILNSVRDHRRTAVRSGHGVGKATRLRWQRAGGSIPTRPARPS
jgi:hypothetical protein